MYLEYSTSQNQSQEILVDERRIGTRKKVIDWKSHKMYADLVSKSFERQGLLKKAFRMSECGSFLEFVLLENGNKKLKHANFCKIRLCPMCSWRRSLKTFAQVSKVMNVYETEKKAFLFLTLTCRNVSADELSNTLDMLFKAFHSFVNLNRIKDVSDSWFRCLEITYNRETDTFHPHFHCVLSVDEEEYFCGKGYIKQADLVALWKKCLKADYTPVVDIRRFKRSTGKEVAEVSKYAVKPTDYLQRLSDGQIDEVATDRLISILEKALHGRRLVAFGGKFKKIHKLLNLDDVEDGDLVVVDGEIREDLVKAILIYKWHVGFKQYVLVEREEI